MTWAEHHQRSEALAEQAFLAMQSGQEARARALYTKAAEEEEQALNDLDTSKQRTLGITGVSAVSLWYKSNELQKAEQLARRLLNSKKLPEFASISLRRTLEAIDCAPQRKNILENIRHFLKRFKPTQTDEGDRGIGLWFKNFAMHLALPNGKFTPPLQDLVFSSIQKVLFNQFHMEVVCPSVQVLRNGEYLKMDILAYANSGIDQAYVVVVEVEGDLEEAALEELQNTMQRFRFLFPEHQNKTVYGILATKEISSAMQEKVLQAGFYVAHIRDEIFKLDVPANFKPQAY